DRPPRHQRGIFDGPSRRHGGKRHAAIAAAGLRLDAGLPRDRAAAARLRRQPARRRRHGIRRGVLRALQAAADRAAHRARRSAGPEGAPDRALVPRLLRDRDALRARARLSRAEDHRLPDQLRLRSPFHRRVRPPAHHRARDRERDRIRLAQEPAPGILEQVGESMKFIAAAIQMLASEDKEANLAHAEKAVLEAAARGARLAALPEVFNWRGDKADEKKNAEPLGGPTAERMARLARELKIYLLAGSFLEEIPE